MTDVADHSRGVRLLGMNPRGLLGLSSLLMTGLFVGLLTVQGRALPDEQLQGILVGAVLSLALTILVFCARSFAAAARWYIASLVIAVLGTVAAAVVRQRLGDVVGLVGSITAALVCASQCVSRLRAQPEDDAVISPRAVRALAALVDRVGRDAADTLRELSDASATSEPYLIERLRQLRAEAAYAAAWSRRMRLDANHPATRALTSLQRRLSA